MSDWKGVSFLVKVFEVLLFVTLAVLSIETVSYVGFFQNNLGISSSVIFGSFIVLYVMVLWFFIEQKEIAHSKFFVNNTNLFYKLILPVLCVYLSLIVLEGLNYKNYVLAEFHVSLDSFFNLYVFSIFFVIYFLLVVKRDFIFIKKIVVALPLLFVGIIYLQTWGWYDFWHRTGEDKLIENFQFVFYLLSSFLALKVSNSFKDKSKAISLLYALVASFLLVVAMEEISWGQRLLQLETPEVIRRRNIQGETNIHNLTVFQSFLHDTYMIVGFLGASLWLAIPKRFKSEEWYKVFVPPSFLSTLFFLPFFYYLYVTHIDTIVVNNFGFVIFPTNHWQEIAELFLSIAVLVFMSYGLYKRRPS